MTVSRPPHNIQPTYTEQYDLCFHWDISCSGLPHSNFYFHQFLFVLNVEKRHQNVCWHQENYTDIHSFHPCGAFESYVMPLCNRCEVNSELQNNWYKTNRPLNQTNVTGVWNDFSPKCNTEKGNYTSVTSVLLYTVCHQSHFTQQWFPNG